MAYTYDELHQKTVAQLRDIAKGIEHEAVQGYSTMRKEPLLLAVCKALGLEAHAQHEVVGINRRKVKAQIRTLKSQRASALEAHNRKELKLVRRKIRRLKRKIRKATV